MKRLVLLTLALALGGCASTNFENRIALTPGCDRGFLVSLYGKIGLSTEIDARDTAALCKRTSP